MPLSEPPLMVTRSPGRKVWRVAASWPPVMSKDGASFSNARVGAQASRMTSPSRCVIAGAGPVWASSGAVPASRAAVTNARIGHPVGFISLLPPSPSGFGEASAVQKLLRGQCFEPLVSIGQILAAVEFLDQPVVVGDCFCFL